MDSLRSALNYLESWLDWLPGPAVGLIVIALAGVIALTLHLRARRLARRLFSGRYPFALTITTRLRGLTRLAIVIVALIVVLPVAPIPGDLRFVLARVLIMAIIGLAGWATIVALDIAADIYLLRFRLDTADNLLARKHTTQVRVLLRAFEAMVALFTIGAALMTFEVVRQYGVSLFASAGVAGIVAGLAARPMLSNLIAGVQLAMTQPIRLDDAVVVEGEWGTIEEITSTYVVVRIWDLRRLIVPLSYFIEKPFQNWTRESSALLGAVLFYLDYRAPISVMREKLADICKQSKSWNGKTAVLQVTDAKETTIEVRALVSANAAGHTFDLRCEVREKMIDFLQREHPEALPRQRSLSMREDGAPAAVALLAPAPEKPPERERPAARG